MVVENSYSYTRSKGNTQFSTIPDEVRAFSAIIFVSGYSPAPHRKMYWSHDEDVHNKAIAAFMTRNCFCEMMKYLHVSDNANLQVDAKMSKVWHLLSMLNEKCIQYFEFLKTQNLSIYESMVPYYGRQSAKQFICGKSIGFGYKMWVLTTALGYVVQFELYQGVQGRQTQYEGLGMGGSVVVDLITELHEEVGNSFHLTFDNLVTSLKLVDCLTEKQIACTGPIRANRVENEMKTLPIGSFDHVTDDKSRLVVVRWNDNDIVNAASCNYRMPQRICFICQPSSRANSI